MPCSRCRFPAAIPPLALVLLLSGNLIAPTQAAASGTVSYQLSAEGVPDTIRTETGTSLDIEDSLNGIHGGAATAISRIDGDHGSASMSSHAEVAASMGAQSLAASRPRADFSDVYHVTSGSLPDGTPVTVKAVARLIHSPSFDTYMYRTFDTATLTASASAGLGGLLVTGDYSMTKNGGNSPVVTKSGLFDGAPDTVVVNTIVGANISITGSLATDAIGNVTNDGSAFGGSMQLSIGVGAWIIAAGPVTLISNSTGLPAPPPSNADSALVFAHLPPILTGEPLAVHDPREPVPAGFALRAVTPNPIHGAFAYDVVLAAPSRVQVYLLDLQGREAAEIADEDLTPGEHRLEARLPLAPALARGVYFLVARAGTKHAATKVMLIG
jgi:hypothetical protein